MRRLLFSTSTDLRLHQALLVLRVTLGGMLAFVHGYPKLKAGPDGWARWGSAMSELGIDAGHDVFGLLAGLAEFGGGVLLMLGLATRATCLPVLFTMGVAASRHLAAGQGLLGASHAIETGLAVLAIFIAGAGRYSLDARLGR